MTAWDFTKIVVFDTSFSLAAQETNPQGISFSDDGLTMFSIGNDGNAIDQWDLTSAWNVSTASFVYSLDVSPENTDVTGIAVSSNGLCILITGNSGGWKSIYQYDLTVANDLSTASYSGLQLDVSFTHTHLSGITLSTDGTEFYTSGFSSSFIRTTQFTMATPFDLSTATETYSDIAIEQANDLYLSPDGRWLFTVGLDGFIYRTELLTPFDLSTAEDDPDSSFDYQNEITNAYGIYFKPNGTVMYILGDGTVFQYIFSRGLVLGLTTGD